MSLLVPLPPPLVRPFLVCDLVKLIVDPLSCVSLASPSRLRSSFYFPLFSTHSPPYWFVKFILPPFFGAFHSTAADGWSCGHFNFFSSFKKMDFSIASPAPLPSPRLSLTDSALRYRVSSDFVTSILNDIPLPLPSNFQPSDLETMTETMRTEQTPPDSPVRLPLANTNGRRRTPGGVIKGKLVGDRVGRGGVWKGFGEVLKEIKGI